ncbi:glutathione S-transferase family protein [Ancylobacter sp. 6x-1]|uniref:Glutathione S-transferase family protein n=1 Tax=Ancylobacter crimeensis TaxID=2579147 RepID=A0ABT0D938_9HYPH|nr:glutathione S-transferase family protein [Ancylobacter crimeensis]MCK0196460.1 glutathione S-transferase family protein [Ancylobacter crimeensis]
MIRLYWAPQSRSLRALWVLEESGLPYVRELIDIRSGVQQSPAYRRINPMMKVPALTEGAARVTESGAICAYVAERAPEAGLAPPLGDPRRGDYLRWLFFSPACMEGALTEKFSGAHMPSASVGWGSFERVFDVLDAALAKGPWLLGADFSAADVMIGADLYYSMEVFKVVEPRPSFTAYLDRCKARPALQRAWEIDAAG